MSILVTNETLEQIGSTADFDAARVLQSHHVPQIYDQIEHSSRTQWYGSIAGHSLLIWATEKHIGGHCSCGKGDDYEFCIHMRCLVLAIQERQKIQKRLDSTSDRGRVRAYLSRASMEYLSHKLLTEADNNQALFQQLLIESIFTQKPIDINLCKEKITQALPSKKKLLRHSQIRDYFDTFTPFAMALQAISPRLDSMQLLELTDHSIQRLENVLIFMDDAHGYHRAVTDILIDIELDTLRQKTLQPVFQQRWILQRQPERQHLRWQHREQYHSMLLPDVTT